MQSTMFITSRFPQYSVGSKGEFETFKMVEALKDKETCKCLASQLPVITIICMPSHTVRSNCSFSYLSQSLHAQLTKNLNSTEGGFRLPSSCHESNPHFSLLSRATLFSSSEELCHPEGCNKWRFYIKPIPLKTTLH